MNLSKEKFLIKRHSERSHAVAKSKNLGRCVIASLVRGAAIACLLFLAACGDDPKVGGTEEDAGIIAIENKTVSGVSQKGPFVNGSSVTVYGLDGETLAQTGNIYEGKIRSDMGDFSVKVVKLASQYALLKANGFYRNEVTGEKSNSQMTLYALTDLSDRDEVNVNLLTHLAYERSLYLATNSMSVASAKAQAEAEVFKSFEIEGDFASAEDLNIFGENDQSAALLAISVMMQGDLKEADFSERLDNYARDIETDGVWDDKNTATFIADWASEKSLSGGLASVRANVEKWGQLFGVPPFEKYVNNFWWQNYGLGTCDAKREGEVKINSNALSANNGVHFICNNGGWRVATDLEKDTATWGAGKFDGEIRAGQINKENYYIYETNNKAWRDATTLEKDTYDYKENKAWTGKDGDSHYGVVDETNCYVFEDKAWRNGNESDCSLGLRGCTALRKDTVGLGSDNAWYKCVSQIWRTATDIEKDTAAWGAGKSDGEVRAGQVNKTIYYIYETGKKSWRNATTQEKDLYGWTINKDGSIKKGNVTDTFYVYDDGAYRIANARETYVNEGCTIYNEDEVNVKSDTSDYICKQGKWEVKKNVLVDSRDNQSYDIVRIGKQVWMAQDLNYADTNVTENLRGSSWCWAGRESCDSRLYYWNAAMNISSDYQMKEYGKKQERGICPEKWHIPSTEEWSVLVQFVGGASEAWFLLKDWESIGGRASSDLYGFSANWNEGGDFSSRQRECNGNQDWETECCEDAPGINAWCINSDGIRFFGTGGSYYWSSSESESLDAFVFHLIAFPQEVKYAKTAIWKTDKKSTYSVRCVKDVE